MVSNVFKSTLLIALGLILSLAVSCRPEPVTPQEGRILILEPSADSTISSPDITIRTYVEFFKLVDRHDKEGQGNVPGEGHIVYYLDVTPPMKPGESALTAAGTYFVTTDKIHVWDKITTGAHTFTVQLVNNDNTPLEPPSIVRSPVTVTLK